MRRTILWVLFIISLMVLAILVLRVISGEDGWLCTSSGWVKHGNPDSPQPTTSCSKAQSPVETNNKVGEPLEEVSIFFGNTKYDPDVLNCEMTYGVSRRVAFGANKFTTVLTELLQGPSESEKNLGFFTTINPGIKLPTVTLASGVLTVNFGSDLEKAVGGSCRVASIRSQIVNTLKQFPEVKDVIISVDGRVDDVLQP